MPIPDSLKGQTPARPLDALKAEPIAGTEPAASPFFSPDGQWIAFFAGSKLKKVPVGGGAAMTLCDAGGTLSTRGGAWGANNIILLQATSGTFLEIPASGGTPHRLPASVKHAFWRWPELTPGGGAVLFAGGAAGAALASSTSITAATLDGAGPEKDLIVGGSAPRLTAIGDLIYVRNGTLMAVPFNSRHLELSGSPTPVLEGVRESMMGAAQYSLSQSGTLIYVPGGLQGNVSRLVWVDRVGKAQPIPAPPRVYDFPMISRDGRPIAVTVSETDNQVWLYDVARDVLSRATFEGVLNTAGAWSPDSKRLAIISDRRTPHDEPFSEWTHLLVARRPDTRVHRDQPGDRV
jgi:eukaryotic-like serine/threonine-protein kinase